MFDSGDPGGERWTPEREAAIDALQDKVAVLCGIGNATAAAQVRLVAAALADGLWRQSGIRSADHWVGWQMGVSPGRAQKLVAIARRRTDLPVAFAAFAAGELSEDQMAVICRHTPSPCDASVTRFARSATVAQLRYSLSRYQWKPPGGARSEDDDQDEIDDEPDPDPEEQRRVSFHFGDDAMWQLFARLSPDEGAALEAALAAARDDLFHARFGDDIDDHEPGEISWADALAHMANQASSPEATGHPVRERHRVHLHLHHRRMNDLFGGGDGEAGDAEKWTLNLHKGPALPDTLRRYLLCDSDLTPVFEQLGVPVSVGRAQRTVPDRTRTLIEERDRGCRFPACPARRWLHVHHIVHWEDGGPTDTSKVVCC